jgi:hypothetical protein
MARSSIVPSPVGQDWRSWANLLVTYLNDAQSTEVINPPRPVALGHKLPNRVQSAVSPGVLMFDVTDMAPVYSDGVDWLLMLSEDRGNEIYVRKSGGTMTGPLVVDNEVRAFRTGTAAQYASITGGDASGPRVDFSGAAGNPKGGLFNLLGDTTGLFHFLNGGVEFARVEPGSSPATNGTLLNRAMGDARYLNLTGGTLTDDLIVSGTSPPRKGAASGLTGLAPLVFPTFGWKRTLTRLHFRRHQARSLVSAATLAIRCPRPTGG